VKVGVIAASAALLCACQLAAPGAVAGGPIRVVAAESMWGDLAVQLGGDRVEVVSLISSPNVDPHSYEPTARDARSVAVAQLLLINGLGYDSWADKLAAASPAAGRTTINIGSLVGLRLGDNPHRWYSPANVAQAITAITAAYVAADPGDAGYFVARATAVQGAFSGYRAALARIKAKYAGTQVGASESIFAPMAQALGLNLITPPTFLRAISEGTDPTIADLRTIDAQITGHQIRVYILNVQNQTPDVARQVALARAASIPIVPVTETLTPTTATFEQWQVAQLNAIYQALGGTR